MLFLAQRDLKVRYKQALLGVAWAVLQPVLGMVALTLVFGRVVPLPSDGVPYPLFAYLGYAVWTYVAGTVGAMTFSLINNAGLVTKVYVPRLAIPLAAAMPGLVDLLLSALLFVPLLLFYGVTPGWRLVAAPGAMVVVLATVLGLGLLLASAHARFRDIGQGLGLLTQLWFVVTPVAYAVSLIPERWRLLYSLNPLAGALNILRWAVLGGTPPGAELLISVLSAALLLSAGLLYFTRIARHLADVI